MQENWRTVQRLLYLKNKTSRKKENEKEKKKIQGQVVF